MKALSTLVIWLWSALVAAHPLGNNTVNRAVALTMDGDTVRIDYRQELAEIPTLLAQQSADRDGDGQISRSEWQAFADAWSGALLPALHLSAAQRALALQSASLDWQLLEGAAGLQQLRLHGVFTTRAPLRGSMRLHFVDASAPTDSGWRELWVRAERGARIVESGAARHDRSAGLTRFPVAGAALPHDTTADLRVDFSGAPRAPNSITRAASPLPAATHRAGLPALFVLGMHHIATGWDHLVFLLGLVLLCRSMRALLAVVSAFTVAHSLTLGLAAAGLVAPPGAVVEPAIALSIAYVGLCNVRQRRGDHGMVLAFAFGLIHGFGFAGALAKTLGAQAFGGHDWLWSLLAFNLGIESFQVALLCVLVPGMVWAARRSWAARARRGASHAVLWSGLAWFAMRVAGV